MIRDPFLLGVFLIFSVLLVILCANHSYAQSSLGNFSNTSTNSSGVVSVASTVIVSVSNETLKDKVDMLRSAVSTFLNAGVNVLKVSQSEQPTIKTKISNLINKDNQNVEGVEATNAIVGVELNKALRTVISSGGLITVQTISTCKPSSVDLISCENVVTLK